MGVEFGLAKFAQNTYCDFPVQNYGLLPQRLAQVVVTFHYLSPYYAVQFFMFMGGAWVGCGNN